MKKAIIVINVPDDVELSNAYAQVITHFGREMNDFPGLNYEIRPMPEKMDVEKTRNLYGDEQATCAIGYNACINDILGE